MRTRVGGHAAHVIGNFFAEDINLMVRVMPNAQCV